MMPILPELLKANRGYAATFTKGNLSMPPRRKLVVLVCMDARIDPAKALGFEEGDAHVIRNAGGLASDDTIHSLAISQQLLGTCEIVVIHHTDCGMLTFTNDQLRAKLKNELGADASTIDFLPFSDLERSVRDDLGNVATNPPSPERCPNVGTHL